MLRIHQSASAEAAKSYYSSGLSAEGYYSIEGAGKWFGRGADLLGLSGDARPEDFLALCDNRRPESGTQLNPRNDPLRKVGYDFTFLAPKSVSIMYEVLGDDRILGVFEQAVWETMLLIEMDAQVRVRQSRMVNTRKVGNLVGCAFIHHTAREVLDESGSAKCDPLLHCHFYVFNTCFDDVENRFKAAELFPVLRDAPYFEAVFHSKMAMGLRALGYGIELTDYAFEIKGVGRENIERFSARSFEIERLAEKMGISGDARLVDKLAALSRRRKGRMIGGEERLREWHKRLLRNDLDYHRHSGSSDGLHPDAAVSLAVCSSFERRSVSPIRRLVALALTYSLGTAKVEEIESVIAARPDLIVRERDGELVCTTDEILSEEARILQFLKLTKGDRYPIQASVVLNEPMLDGDQRIAIEAVLRSTDRVYVIEGKAGAGKTTLMKTAIDAMEAAGERVFTFAPTSQASHQVLRSEGFSKSETVQRLIVSAKLQEAVKHAVIWIDEAGLLSTREMDLIFSIADKAGARVILSGDRGQNHSVGRGDALRLVVESGLPGYSLVRQIHRQKLAHYKEAVESVATGRLGEGLEILRELEWIHETPSFSDRLAGIADEYLHSRKSSGSILIVSPTHFEGRALTFAVRSRLKEVGNLEGDELFFPVFRSRNLTQAERSIATKYKEGDVIKFHQNAKGGFRKGETWRVREICGSGVVVTGGDLIKVALDLEATAAHFDVAREQKIPLAVGDSVRLLANCRSIEGKRLFNGSIHRITEIDGCGNLVFGDGSRISGSSGLCDHGYVVTSHSSQGKTVDKVIICQGAMSRGAASLEQFYVSLSRGRYAASLWTDSIDGLFEAVKRSDRRLLATEIGAGSDRGGCRLRLDDALGLEIGEERNGVFR